MTSVLDDLDQLTARARDELDELELAKDRIESQMRRLRSFIKMQSPDEPKAAAKPRVRNSGQCKPGVCQGILKYIQAHGEHGTFSAVGVHQFNEFDWSEPTTYTTFKSLRDAEVIGKAGVEQSGNVKRTLYRVLDEEGLKARAAA